MIVTREETDLAMGPAADGTCSCPSVLVGTPSNGNLVLCPASISTSPTQFTRKRKTYTRLQPIHAREGTRNANTPADISPPPHQGSLHHQIHHLASRGPTRCECPIAGVIRSAEDVVLRLAPHDALRQVRLRNHDGAEAFENQHKYRGSKLRCVVDVRDIADGRVDTRDAELVLKGHREAVERATLGWWEGIEFSSVGKGTGEEGLGEGVCLGFL